MTIKTIYRFGQDQDDPENYWFSWDKDVDVVRTPLLDDTSERTCYTGDGLPKITDSALALTGGTNFPMNSYTLGVPKPAAAPTASVTGTGSGAVVTRYYVYRYVNSFGQPGPPSDPVKVDWQAGQSITINGMSGAPAGAYNMAKKQLYRSQTGSLNSVFLFVKDVGIGSSSTPDTVADGDLGVPLDSTWYFPPPTDGFGMTAMANGINVLFSGHQVYFSEPFLPHAYNPNNIFACDSEIVGGVGFGNSVLVTTKAEPVVLTGTFPDQMTPIRTAYPYACISKRSIVALGGGALYAAAEGLIKVDGSGVSLVTRGMLSKDQWEKYNPSSIHAYAYDGRYYAFYQNGSTSGLLVFNFLGEGVEMWESDIYTSAAYSDKEFGLFIVKDADVNKWDGSLTLRKYIWRSKIFQMPYPLNFSAGQISARAYPVHFRYYVDGVLMHEQDVLDPGIFRLPGGFKGFEHEVELEGINRVNGAYLATSVAELKTQ